MTAGTAKSDNQGTRSGVPSKSSDLANFDARERLVWYPLQGIWWPGIFYNSLEHFSTVAFEECQRKGDTGSASKARLALHLLKIKLEAEGGGYSLNHSVVRYLGRPIFHFKLVKQGEYQIFDHFLARYLITVMINPTVFGQSKYDLYMEYHRGIDESIAILRAEEGGTPYGENDETFEERAKKSWEDQSWTNVRPAEPQQAQQQQPQKIRSPNTNIGAGVAVVDECLTEFVVHEPETQNPELETSPIRNARMPWKQVWQKLHALKWRAKITDIGKIYSHPSSPDEFTEDQLQDYVRKRYNWQGGGQSIACHSKAKGGSQTFAHLWKKCLQRDGWRKVKAPETSEWLYVRPDHSENGVPGEDYFNSEEDVVDLGAQGGAAMPRQHSMIADATQGLVQRQLQSKSVTGRPLSKKQNISREGNTQKAASKAAGPKNKMSKPKRPVQQPILTRGNVAAPSSTATDRMLAAARSLETHNTLTFDSIDQGPIQLHGH